jgi:hypothetical protein
MRQNQLKILVVFVLISVGYLPDVAAQPCGTAPGALCDGYNNASCSTTVLTDCSAYPRCLTSAGNFVCDHSCYNTGLEGSCGAGRVCLCINRTACSLCTSVGQDLAVCSDTGCGAADSTPPTVVITTPTANATYTSPVSPIGISGTAADDTVLTAVTWTNDRNQGFLGGSGAAHGTATWDVSYIVLEPGQNVITVTAADGSGHTGTDTLTVTYSPPAAAGYPAITLSEDATSYTVNISTASTLNEVAYAWGKEPTVYVLVPFANNSTPSLSAAEQTSYDDLFENLPGAWDRLTGNRHPLHFVFFAPFVLNSYSYPSDADSSLDQFNYLRAAEDQFEADHAGEVQSPAIYVLIYPEPYFGRTYVNIFGSPEKALIGEIYFASLCDGCGGMAAEVRRNILVHEITHVFAMLPNNVNFPPGTDKYFWLSHPAYFYGAGGTCDENTSLLDCPSYAATESPTGTPGSYEIYSVLSSQRLPLSKQDVGGRDVELSPLEEMAVGVRSKYEDAPYMYYEGSLSNYAALIPHDYSISSRWLHDYTALERVVDTYWNLRFESTKTSLAATTRVFNLPKSDQTGRALIVFTGENSYPDYFKVFGNGAHSDASGITPPRRPSPPSNLHVN